MKYTGLYHKLKSVFDINEGSISIPGSGVKIINTPFLSDVKKSSFISMQDLSVDENISFSYPVFVPAGDENKKVILLFHGLNERSWTKYLTWAYSLSVSTGSYVILFPISFHINRSPLSWTDPRGLLTGVYERKKGNNGIDMTSFANLALSMRLTDDPLRFFKSGYQTANDIITLMKQIENGTHPVVPAASRVDVFAYSIGAFLSQILFIGNPSGIFSKSKLFMFCGGSVFSNMKGTSKYIMDSLAFNKIYRYFMKDFEDEIKVKNELTDYLNTDRMGLAFRAMIDYGRHARFREKNLSDMGGRSYCISLSDDRIIPPSGIVETMKPAMSKSGYSVQVLDLPYKYTHENPFPVVTESSLTSAIDDAFDLIFAKAATFLA